MARGFAASLAGDRIRVFGLVVDDERTGVAATPTAVARAIAQLAGTSPPASGPIVTLVPKPEPAAVG
jgi:hypothetical protein